MHNMTDSHFHALAMKSKGIEPIAAITNARANGLAEALDIGLHPSDLKERLHLFAGFEGVYHTSGIAPAEAASQPWREELHTLRRQAEARNIVAVGELGLDWHWNYGSKKLQIELMWAQIKLAGEMRLPVVIHNREADADVLDILRTAALTEAGIMHCFSSNYRTAIACIDLGYMISFAGNVTYKKSEDLQDTARRIPIESLLVETDAPFLSPQAVRGKPNSPENIHHTYQFLAHLRNVPVEKLVETVRNNLRRIIHITHLE